MNECPSSEGQLRSFSLLLPGTCVFVVSVHHLYSYSVVFPEQISLYQTIIVMLMYSCIVFFPHPIYLYSKPESNE